MFSIENHPRVQSKISQLTPQLYLSGTEGRSQNNLEKYHINLVINASKDIPSTNFTPKNGEEFYEIRVPVDDSEQAGDTLYPYFKVICICTKIILFALLDKMIVHYCISIFSQFFAIFTPLLDLKK